ncbi:MAG: tRNA (N6-isopentenyl adenosine(37)-C2)-methylthiotransferase MiaB [Opitutales bacterium]
MNRVYIKTYGCQMNERDSEAVAALLRGRGYSVVAEEGEADVVLLNTCSVRDKAEQKAIGKAGHLLARNGRGKPRKLAVGIMGCMAQNRGIALLDSLPELDLLIGTQKFHRVPDLLDNLRQTLNGQGPKPATLVELDAEDGSQNTINAEAHGGERQISAFVSIMQGCNMNCAFCIVPKTRGPERYRPMDDIVAEVESLVAKGTREVTLLGQIVNQYGTREIPYRDGKSPFVQLLERVNAVEGLERIRFTSPHPVGFREDLIKCYGRLEKLCESIHFPMQSGSNTMLKAMRRPYTIERFQRIVQAIRERVPELGISTDVIVGFPGEGEGEFQATVNAFQELQPDMAFIFKYSVRPGAPAADLGDPIPEAVKEHRNQTLLRELETFSLARNQALVGTTQEVLLEGPARRGEGKYLGRTRSFRKVILPASERLIGQQVPVRITEATVTTLSGELVLAEEKNTEAENYLLT